MALTKPLQHGIIAFALLLMVYFGVVSLISGWAFALRQFNEFRYFLILLAIGFGIQVGLYRYLKEIVDSLEATGKFVAVSGTTSTVAMVSCCAHYLSNILPILGTTGALALVAQYQIELFWLALAFNVAGILYIVPKVFKASREHARCLSHS